MKQSKVRKLQKEAWEKTLAGISEDKCKSLYEAIKSILR